MRNELQMGEKSGRARMSGNGGPLSDSATRVVIVEDEVIVAWNLSEVLERLGYEVVGIAHTAEDAVALTGEHDPDLVLMDVRLASERDGVDAATEIRERFGLGVVFLTSNGDVETLARAAVTEPLGYLYKPYSEQGLAESLRIVMPPKKN